MQEQLKQAIRLFKTGDKQQAKQLITAILKEQPEYADAWYAASMIAEKDEQKLKFLKNALSINPQHPQAKAAYDQLMQKADPFEQLAALSVADHEIDMLLEQVPPQSLRAAGDRQGLAWVIAFIACMVTLFVVVFSLVALGNADIGPLAAALGPTDTSTATPTQPVTETPTPTSTATASATATSIPEIAQGQPTQRPTFTPTSTFTSSPTLTPIPTHTPNFALEYNADGQAVTFLDFQVTDAEYSKSLNRIVLVSDAPLALQIYDPDARQVTASVPLPRSPTSVSVSPNGLFAAVGHDALITYIDLQQATVVKTLNVAADVGDIVLGDNGFVYAIPIRDQWETIRNINIATNVETSGGGIRAGSIYRMHPSGTKLYGADRGLSPSDIERATIGPDGLITEVRDSPYHGDYGMCGDVWIAEDGLRLITACGATFISTDSVDSDMTYNGSLEGTRGLSHVAHAAQANLILGVAALPRFSDELAEQATYSVWVWDYNTLVPVTQVALPSVSVGDELFPTIGRFVFSGSDSSHYYVLVQADPEAGLLHNWGVVVGLTDQLR